MNRFLISNFLRHLRTTFAVNSGPLSDLIWQGNPLFKNSSARTSTTSWALKCLLTFSARHSLVYSSIRVRILKDRPSWVRSATKSYDQTWFLNSGFKRKQDPSLNHNLDRLAFIVLPSLFKYRKLQYSFVKKRLNEYCNKIPCKLCRP